MSTRSPKLLKSSPSSTWWTKPLSLTKWEALKCVLQSIFIQHGTRLKKEQTAEINRLLALISSLESSHKQTLDLTTLLDLSNIRQDLLRLFDTQSLMAKEEMKQTHYGSANKCGHHLANFMHPRPPRQAISYLAFSTNTKFFNNLQISSAFHDYYSTLYNLSSS